MDIGDVVVFDGVEMGDLCTWIRPGCDCMHLLLNGITALMSSCMHVAHHTQKQKTKKI